MSQGASGSGQGRWPVSLRTARCRAVLDRLVGSAPGVFLGGEGQRALADVAEMPLLDRQRPVDQLLELGLCRLLVQLAEALPVAQLSGLGHGEAFEAIEV